MQINARMEIAHSGAYFKVCAQLNWYLSPQFKLGGIYVYHDLHLCGPRAWLDIVTGLGEHLRRIGGIVKLCGPRRLDVVIGGPELREPHPCSWLFGWNFDSAGAKQ